MLSDAIAFIIESEKLKAILRHSHPVGLTRRENSAEHSWTATLAATVLIPELAPTLDQLRIIKMLTIHDLVEIDAGDILCYADQTGKAEREAAAAQRLFSILPPQTEKEFHQLFREFEDKLTPESKFANSIDRILPLIQNFQSEGVSWIRNKVTFEQVYHRNREIKTSSPELWDYAKNLITTARDYGWLPSS